MQNYLYQYAKKAYTNKYIIGVAKRGTVYAYFITLDGNGLTKLFTEKDTNKDGDTLRYRSTKQKINFLEENGTGYAISTLEDFEASREWFITKNGKKKQRDRGVTFEKLLALRFSGTLAEAENLKYTDGGDIVINGVAYQVKYERGGITVSL